MGQARFSSAASGAGESSPVHPTSAIRNPLLEPSPWIFDIIFGNFGDSFWLIFGHPGASGPQHSIPDGLTDLRAQNESRELVSSSATPFSIIFAGSVNDSRFIAISLLRNHHVRV